MNCFLGSCAFCGNESLSLLPPDETDEIKHHALKDLEEVNKASHLLSITDLEGATPEAIDIAKNGTLQWK